MMAFVTNVLILEPVHSVLCSISKRRRNSYWSPSILYCVVLVKEDKTVTEES